MSERPPWENDVPPEDAVPASTPDSLKPDADGKTIELSLSDGVTAESGMGMGPKRVEGPNDHDLVPPEERDEAWEQAERDRHGYAPTEKRTKEERDAAADRMLGRLRGEPLDLPPAVPYSEDNPPEPPLPREVTDVWGVSLQSLALAEGLIKAWGLRRFLDSELHTQAVKESESNDRMAPIRAAYVKAVKAKEKK